MEELDEEEADESEELIKIRAAYIKVQNELAELRTTSKGYEDLWKEVEAKVKVLEAEGEKMKADLHRIRTERSYYVGLSEAVLESVLSMRELLLNKLQNLRMESALAYKESVSFVIGQQKDMDEARAAGFKAAIGQCKKQGWIPEGANLETLGVSSFKDADGKPVPVPKVSDEAFLSDEFVQLVDETLADQAMHNGPFLPPWVPDVLKKICFTPFGSFDDFHKSWFALPGPVIGMEDVKGFYEQIREKALAFDKAREE